MQSFHGKVALVTGGGSGIGRTTALAFAQRGANVVVAGRNAKAGEETVQLIEQLPESQPGQGLFLQTDVSQAEDVERLIARTVETYGRLDYAFNNAGTNTPAKFLAEISEQEWDGVLDVNLKGVWLSMKYEILQMLKQGFGAIVNNASVAGHVGTAYLSSYTASKHGVIGLTKVAALEYSKSGIRVNAVSPGAVITPIAIETFGSEEAFLDFMIPLHPIGKVGQTRQRSRRWDILAAIRCIPNRPLI